MEGKVSINNKIDHVVSCINIETIAEPIDTIVSRQHGVKHEILKVGQVLSWEEVCFVHDGIIADFGGNLNLFEEMFGTNVTYTDTPMAEEVYGGW